MVFNGDVSQKLNSIVITSEDVMSKIINFKDGKAPGNDGIIPEFLKHILSSYIVLSCSLSTVFTVLMNE